MQLIEQLICRLNMHLANFRDPPEPPCDPSDLDPLQDDAVTRLGHRLPDDYTAMLRCADGLHFNGLYMLASRERPVTGHPEAGTIEGVVDDNLDYWCLLDSGMIVLGYEEAFAYAYDVGCNRYVRLLRSDKSVVRDYRCFGEMLADALDWARVPITDLLPEEFAMSWPKDAQGPST